MKKFFKQSLKQLTMYAWFVFIAVVIIPSCQKFPHLQTSYEQVNLVANNNKYGAARIDPAFINVGAWR
ncbi:MAG: hypothetical protein ABIR81_07445 [Ginsengibacter sp.]